MSRPRELGRRKETFDRILCKFPVCLPSVLFANLVLPGDIVDFFYSVYFFPPRREFEEFFQFLQFLLLLSIRQNEFSVRTLLFKNILSLKEIREILLFNLRGHSFSFIHIYIVNYW